MAINSNRFAKELMNDPWVVTLEEVKYELK
jgi:hypothetical protein